MSILIMKPIPEEKINQAAVEAVTTITKWFEANPSRDTCKARLFYGTMHTINRTSIEQDIEAARVEAIKLPDTML